MDLLEGKFDPVTTAAKRYEAELADLQDAQRAGIVTGDAYERELQRIADAHDPATIAARKLREEAEKDAAAFRVLEDRLDTLGAATRRAAETQAKLDKALSEGRISYERYTVLSRALNDTGRAGETAAKGTKLAAHELTNLTYQLQDTVVSLAGGMNPLLVLMQQGPQATSAVGGVGRALSLLASPAGLATLAIGGVAVGFGLVAVASEKHQKSILAVNTSTRLMGDAIGLSSTALEDLAVRSAETGNITVTAAREQESAYIRTGKIGAESMEALIGLSRDYAAATNKSADEATADLAGLFSDPVAGMERLQAAYGILTAKEMEHVRQLKATGREEEARVLLADRLGNRVRGLADNTTTFAQAWERVGRASSNAFDAVGQAVAPETNAQAIKRLEEERRRLIEARNLDQARVDAETGGAAGREAVPIDSRLAAPGMATYDRDLAAKDAELTRRRAVEARAREQAALLKDVRDRDRFQVEADEITRAARPLGTQVDAVTEKVTKLKRAFGEDMAGASDQAKVGLAGLENQLADLNTVAANGGDLDAYKRKRQAEADKQAAGMVGPAREKFLAQQRQEIELFGTATSKAERKAQVDAAGAAVTNSQTQAIAAQNAQTAAAIRGTVAAADAYRESLAAGIEADARRQAQSEAVTSAIDVEARTRQLVAERAGEEAVSLAQATQQIELETEAQRGVVDATGESVAVRMEAERAAQVAKTTSTALAAAQAAEKAGNIELAKRLRELAAGYDAASKKAAALSRVDALKQYNQQQRDTLEQQRLEASLVGRTADERTRALAIQQAELLIRQRGIDVTKELSEEERKVVDQTRQLAVETADLQIATEHSRDAWEGVGDAIDDAVVRPLESAVDAIVKGQGETVKWGNLWRAALTSLAVDVGKMALVNPAKNALGIGGGNSPSLWDLGGGSGSGGISLTNNDGSGILSLGGLASKASGGWLDRQFGGGISSASSWLNTSAYGGPSSSMMAGIDDVGQLGYAPGTGAGVTYGDMIGGVGYGVGAISSFANNKPVSGIANTAATVMSFIPGLQMYAPIVAIAGTLLEGLFGQDRGPPTAAATVTYRDGKQVVSSAATDNEDDPQQAQQLLESITAATSQFIGAIGGKTTADFGVGVEGRDGRYKARTLTGELTGDFGSLDEAVIAAFKKNVEGGLVDASTDVLTAVKNVSTKDINEFMAKMSFAANFQDSIDAMTQSIGLEDTARKQGKASAEELAKQLTEFRTTTAELGLDVGKADAATKQYVDTLVSGADPKTYTAFEAQVATATAQWEAMGPVLQAVGYSAEEARKKITEGLTNTLNKLRAAYNADLTTRYNTASGKGYLNDLAGLEGQRITDVRNGAAIGQGPERAWEVFNAGVASILSGLTASQLDEVARTYGGAVGDLARQMQAATVVTKAASNQQAREDLTGRALRGLGRTDEADDYERGVKQAREIAQAVTDGLDDVTVAAMKYVQWLDNEAVARDRAATRDAKNAGIYIRGASAKGGDVWAATMRADLSAAGERRDAWNAGLRGGDLTRLDQVLAYDRANAIAKAKQQELLTAYDQQIRGLQQSSQAARDFVSTFGQAVRSIRQAMKDWLIGEASPLTPGQQKDTLEDQIAETFAKAMGGDAEALAAIVPLLEKRNTLEAEQTAKTERTLFDDSLAKLAALDETFGPQLDAAERQVKIADEALKVAQQERDAVARYGERQIAVTQDLKDGVLAAFGDLTAAVNAIDLGGTTSTPAPANPEIAKQSAWMAEWFQRFDQLVAGEKSGALTEAQVKQQGTSLWQEKVDGINALGSDPAVWRAVIATARQAPAGGPTADWITQVAHDKGIPTFATGGDHAGGLRLVGERGWEIEATGPSRIWTAEQIATALAAARGELGPNVVGFLPAGQDGGAGGAALVKAMGEVGRKVGEVLTELTAGNHDAAMQRLRAAGDLAARLDRLSTDLADLPRRIAAAG
ncbi:phage tail length tape measure family protein [Azospirillum agricola]|uniref:phage tail length tape measure family protein n=1 Tax=Azospirillum agricola TaxID=1720247 RepID=UPI000A0EF122|nr:phage tail length tape measure family protein [Azospirillum agricola]SMH30530.1 Phage-related minor tail protein [Azospirillum lipoferum]